MQDILLYGKIPSAGYQDRLHNTLGGLKTNGKPVYYEQKDGVVNIGSYIIPLSKWEEWVLGGVIVILNNEEDDMGLIAKDKGGGFEPVEAGVHHAICYGVVDLGTQYSEKYNNDAHKVLLLWELPFERINIDGKDLPRAISRMFTLSLHAKSKLRECLESWRGRAFTEKELEGFDLKNLIKANCQLNVIHNNNGAGKTYANVSAVMPLPKGTAKRELENQVLYFSFDDGMEVPDHMPEWISKIIIESSEWNSAGNEPVELERQMSKNGITSNEDDIPF